MQCKLYYRTPKRACFIIFWVLYTRGGLAIWQTGQFPAGPTYFLGWADHILMIWSAHKTLSRLSFFPCLINWRCCDLWRSESKMFFRTYRPMWHNLQPNGFFFIDIGPTQSQTPILRSAYGEQKQRSDICLLHGLRLQHAADWQLLHINLSMSI